MNRIFMAGILTYVAVVFTSGQVKNQIKPLPKGEKPCFTRDERERAERQAHVYRAPDPGYDPVHGYDPAKGLAKALRLSTRTGERCPHALATGRTRRLRL